MVGDQKVLSFVAYRVQMLYETVSESMLGLTNVEEAISGAADTVDQVDGCTGEPLYDMKVLFWALNGGPKQTYIRLGFTCTSINLVYCIHCSRRGFLYISETKRRLGDRFVEHLRSVRDKRQHLIVANYFNSLSHCLGDMSILGLLQCHNDTIHKLEEQHLIFHLASLQPNGLT
eukprot:g37859.t1